MSTKQMNSTMANSMVHVKKFDKLQINYIKVFIACQTYKEHELMKFSEIKTIKEVSIEYKIPVATLKSRMYLKSFNMIENEDYKKMGERQGILLSPKGVAKITKVKEVKK